MACRCQTPARIVLCMGGGGAGGWSVACVRHTCVRGKKKTTGRPPSAPRIKRADAELIYAVSSYSLVADDAKRASFDTNFIK